MAETAADVQRQPQHGEDARATPAAERSSAALKVVAPPQHGIDSSPSAPACAAPAGFDRSEQPVQGSPQIGAQPGQPATLIAPQQAAQQPPQTAQGPSGAQAPQRDPFIIALKMLVQQGLPEATARSALENVKPNGQTLEECAQPPFQSFITVRNAFS